MARRGGFTIGRGAVAFQFSGELTRAVEEVIRNYAPNVVSAVERKIDKIVDRAEKLWPRGDDKTAPRMVIRLDGSVRYYAPRNKNQPYHSADRFITGIRFVGNDTIEGYIDNDAVNIRRQKYWFFIKVLPGDPGEFSPLQRYIRKPLKESAIKLAEELGDELRAMMRRA